MSPIFPDKFLKIFLDLIRTYFIISESSFRNVRHLSETAEKFHNNFQEIISKCCQSFLKIFAMLSSNFLEKYL